MGGKENAHTALRRWLERTHATASLKAGLVLELLGQTGVQNGADPTAQAAEATNNVWRSQPAGNYFRFKNWDNECLWLRKAPKLRSSMTVIAWVWPDVDARGDEELIVAALGNGSDGMFGLIRNDRRFGRDRAVFSALTNSQNPGLTVTVVSPPVTLEAGQKVGWILLVGAYDCDSHRVCL